MLRAILQGGGETAEAGFDAHLTKPVSLGEVTDAITQLRSAPPRDYAPPTHPAAGLTA